MRNSRWVRILAYVTGSVNQELLLRNEYLAAENRILRTKLPARYAFPIRNESRLPRSESGLAAERSGKSLCSDGARELGLGL